MPMTTKLGTLDFAATEEHARTMSVAALLWSRKDACRTAEILDKADREYGTDKAGIYRDQSTCYVRELRARGIPVK